MSQPNLTQPMDNTLWTQAVVAVGQSLLLVSRLCVCVCVSGSEEWIQFDLGVMRFVYSLVTRGRDGSHDWVTSYRMMFSSDASVWTTYADLIGNDMVYIYSLDVLSHRISCVA